MKVCLKDIVCRIKDVVDKANTDLKYYVGGEHFETGEYRIHHKGIIQGSTIGPAFHMRFQPGDVLLMSRNPHLRKASMVDFSGICSDVSYVCRTKDEKKLLQSFIPILFQTDDFWSFATENKKGSTNFFLNWSDFERYEFNLPPIEEQHKLAEMLWAAYDLKESYKRLLVASDEMAKSQFIEMFGDPEDNPRKWCKLPLKDSVVRIENGKSPVCENFSRVGTNPAVLKLSSISSGYFKATENKALQDGVPFLSAYEVHAGDLLISRKNTLDLVGKACYVFETPEFLQLPDLIFRLDLTHRIHGIFLCFLFNHPSFRPKIQALAGGSAGSMPNISKSRLENLIILVPPIELQNEFAAFIEQLDKSKVANYALRAIS